MPTKVRAIRTGGSNEEVNLKASRDGDLRIAQYLPPLAMICAAGDLFAYDISAGTGKAPVNDMPTTSPEWSIYNANPSGGKHIVLVHVATSSESGCMGLGIAIAAAVGVGDQTVQVANYASTVVSCLDGSAKKPNAYLANNVGIVGTQPAWTVLESRSQLAVVSVGSGVVARPEGIMAAPPGDSLFFEPIMATGVSVVFNIYIVVAQVQLDAYEG